MRFPLHHQLELPCVFEQLVPGDLHPDGQRYLPLILLRPTRATDLLPAGLVLGVVDRHHCVDEQPVGRSGVARLVFALSALRVQKPPFRQGLVPEPDWRGGVSTAPGAFGQIVAVGAWELTRGPLPYETLYTELTLDIGLGVIGTRTNLTATSLAALFGQEYLAPGSAIELTRSRIDLLEFVVT